MKIRTKWLGVFSLLACSAFAVGFGIMSNANVKEAVAEDATLSALELQSSYQMYETVEIPSATFSVGNENVKANTIVYYPDGKGYDTDSVYLSQNGIYTVRYIAEKDGITYQEEKTFKTATSLYSFSGTNSTVSYGQDNSVWGLNRTGLRVSLAEGETMSFNTVFNLNENTESFIDLIMVPKAQDGKAEAQAMYVVLTDAYNPDNQVSIWLKFREGGKYTYAMAKATDQLYSGSQSSGGGYIVHVNNAYGSVFVSSAGNPNFEGRYNHFALSYNSITNAVYGNGALLCDFDDASYQAKLWEGFTTGEVFVSLYCEDYLTSSADMIITSMTGVDLSNENVGDAQGPKIEVDFGSLNEEEIPVGQKGATYTCFDAIASDNYSQGEVTLQKRVFFNYERASGTYDSVGTKYDYELNTANGKFKTDKTGTYSIVYRAWDWCGNVTEKVVNVKVEDSYTNNLQITFADYITQTEVGSYTELPAIATCNGGRGELEFVYEVVFNGKAVALAGNRFAGFSFIPEQAGEYTVNVTVKDTLGYTATDSYVLNVSNATSAVFKGKVSLPKYFIAGYNYTLPTLYAVDVNGNNVAANITVKDGIGERNVVGGVTFVPSRDGTAIVKYSCGAYEQSYTIPVVVVKNGDEINTAKYFIAESKELEVSLEETGVYLSAKKDCGTAEFVNKLAADGLTVNLSIDSKANDFEYLIYRLEDSVDSSIAVEIMLKKELGETNYASVWVNGKRSNFRFDDIFNSINRFGIIYNAERRTISDGSGLGAQITETVNGEPFEGFTSNFVYMSVGMGGISSRSGVSIMKIANQNLVGTVSDLIAPNVVFEHIYDDVIADINETVNVWAAYVSDVLASEVFASVSVTKDGKAVYAIDGRNLADVSVDERYQFIASEYGVYMIAYIFTDANGRTIGYNYSINVNDTEAPVLGIPVGLVQEAKVGDIINAPIVKATDNVDGNVSIYVSVVCPDYKVLPIDGKLKYEKAGVYLIRYTAMDSAGNTSYADYTVIVK